MPTAHSNGDTRQLQRLMPGVPGAAIDELVTTARTMVYAAGERIMDGGRLLPGIVAEGSVRLVVRTADGREAILRTIRSGEMFGLMAVLDPRESPTAALQVEREVVAVKRSTVTVFDRPALLRLAQQHCGLAMYLVRNFAEYSSVMTDAASRFAFMTVRQRLAGHLLAIAAPAGDSGLVALATQQQLANAIGSVREVVARTLHDLREERVVEVSRGKVAILDAGALRRAAHREPDPAVN